VGASGGKKYPTGKMDRLVDILSRKTLLELYWGTDEERSVAEDLCRRYPSRIQPEMSLQKLLERISGLRVFVTADNGPMHVASALSIPVLAIFRVENQDRFQPLSRGSRVLFDPEGTDPEEVAENALEILSYF
jgi:ADP-heptose:LPS heptosyltransferase